jgi:hypothetical protein
VQRLESSGRGGNTSGKKEETFFGQRQKQCIRASNLGEQSKYADRMVRRKHTYSIESEPMKEDNRSYKNSWEGGRIEKWVGEKDLLSCGFSVIARRRMLIRAIYGAGMRKPAVERSWRLVESAQLETYVPEA